MRYTVYREVTRARCYVIVHGWQSAANLDALRDRWAGLEAALRHDGATMLRFAGWEQYTVDPP